MIKFLAGLFLGFAVLTTLVLVEHEVMCHLKIATYPYPEMPTLIMGSIMIAFLWGGFWYLK
jgi:hypothetical protein